MTELDALQLNIIGDVSKAEKAIDGLIGTLSRLNTALNLGNLQTFTEQLREIKTSASGISDISKSISSLADAGSKLSRLTGFKTLNEQSSETEKMVDKTVQTIAKSMNIGKADAKEMSGFLTGVFGDPKAIKDEAMLVDILADTLEKVSATKTEVSQRDSDIVEYARKTKFYVDESTYSWLENQKRIGEARRAFLDFSNDIEARRRGYSNLEDKETQDEWDRLGIPQSGDMIERIGYFLDELAKAKEAINNALVKGEEQVRQNLVPENYFREQAEKMVADLHEGQAEIEAEANKGRDVFGTLADGLKNLSGITFPDFTSLFGFAQSVSLISKANAENVQKVIDAVRTITDLNGIDFTDLIFVFEGLAKLGNIKIKDIGSKVKALAEGVAQVGDESAVDNAANIADEMRKVAESTEEAGESLKNFGTSNASGVASQINEISESAEKAAKKLSELDLYVKEVFDSGFVQDEASSDIASILSDIKELQKTLSSMRSRPEIFDIDEWTAATASLDSAREKWSKFQEEVSHQIKWGSIDASNIDEAHRKLGELIEKKKEYQRIISRTESGEIIPTASYDEALKKLPQVNEEIKKLQESFGNIPKTDDAFRPEPANAFSRSLQEVISNMEKYSQVMASMRRGKATMDVSDYKEAAKLLDENKRKWENFERAVQRKIRNTSLDGLSMEMQRVSDRTTDIKRKMSEMEQGKVGWNVPQYRKWGEELEKLSARYDELLGKKDKVEKPSGSSGGSIDLLANLVAAGHELESLSQTLGRIADQGIKVLKFAFKPLDHVINEYKKKIESLANSFRKQEKSTLKTCRVSGNGR